MRYVFVPCNVIADGLHPNILVMRDDNLVIMGIIGAVAGFIVFVSEYSRFTTLKIKLLNDFLNLYKRNNTINIRTG